MQLAFKQTQNSSVNWTMNANVRRLMEMKGKEKKYITGKRKDNSKKEMYLLKKNK